MTISGPFAGDPPSLSEDAVKRLRTTLDLHGDGSMTGACSICGVHRCPTYARAWLTLAQAGYMVPEVGPCIDQARN